MTTYESEIKTLNCSSEKAFALMTDLTNLQPLVANIPQDKVKDIVLEKDSCRFKVDMLGELNLKIIETEENKTVKFGVENLPMDANMWIQLKEVAECDTKMKVTLKADIPFMLKPMIGSKVDDALKMIVNSIAMAINK